MKKKEFAALGRRLAQELPGFVSKDDLLIKVPIGSVMRAFCFERSEAPRDFHPNVFLLPLYVPYEDIYFIFGKRLLGAWDADAPGMFERLLDAIRNEGIPFLGGSASEGAILLTIIARGAKSGNPHNREAAAYTLAKIGRYAEAVQIINEVTSSLSGEYPWHTEIIGRARLMKDIIMQNMAGVDDQLARWEQETIRNLHLESLMKRS